MMYLRRPELTDALLWWVHIQAVGERIHIPEVKARSRMACLALLSVAPDEVADELRRSLGGLDTLAEQMMGRLNALEVPASVYGPAIERAVAAVSELAFSRFSPSPVTVAAPTPKPGTLPEPPNGASVDTLTAYHAALNAVNAYMAALKAG